MIQLVTLPDVKNAIGVHFTDQDNWIDQLIGAASETILAYMQSDGSEYLDSEGEVIPDNVPERVKAAVTSYVRYFYDHPDIKLDDLSDLPVPVVSLLRDLRPLVIV